MKRFISTACLFSLLVFGQTPAPDNTGKNKRDRGNRTMTADDQPNNPADRELLRKIRRAVTSEKNMSTKARNVKIMVTGGMVTLRGPVSSAEEKQRIEALAKQLAGDANVTNNLEVTGEKH